MSHVCKICGQEFDNNRKFLNHLKNVHQVIEYKTYYDTYVKTATEGICPVCGKETQFISLSKGYNHFCSVACSNRSESTKQKMKATCKKHFGVDNPLKSSIVRDKACNSMVQKYGHKYALQNAESRQKYEETMMQKYGSIIPLNNPDIKHSIECTTEKRYGAKHIFSSEYGKSKRKQTSKEKYGTEYPMQSDVVKANHLQSVRNKYNVENVFELDSVKERIKSNNLESKGVEYSTQYEATKNKMQLTKKTNQEIFSKEHDCIPVADLNIPNVYYYTKHLNIKTYKYKNVNYISKTDVSTILDAYNLDAKKCGSLNEYAIAEFIKSIYDGKILHNTRQVIAPKELDVYIPEKHLAIEHNGIWWHSTNFGIDAMYHKNKTDECLAKGIRLIHIFEDDWTFRTDVCKSYIAQALGIYRTYIDDSDCTVKPISIEEVNLFMANNSLGVYEVFEHNFGLFYKNELVQVLSHSKNRIGCLCTKLNTCVTNGYTKITSSVINDSQVFSFDIDLSIDALDNYKKLHIVNQVAQLPKPFYIYKNTRFYDYNNLMANHTDDEGYLELYNSGYLTIYIGEHDESCLY